jgi:hypothetical protein
MLRAMWLRTGNDKRSGRPFPAEADIRHPTCLAFLADSSRFTRLPLNKTPTLADPFSHSLGNNTPEEDYD